MNNDNTRLIAELKHKIDCFDKVFLAAGLFAGSLAVAFSVLLINIT